MEQKFGTGLWIHYFLRKGKRKPRKRIIPGYWKKPKNWSDLKAETRNKNRFVSQGAWRKNGKTAKSRKKEIQAGRKAGDGNPERLTGKPPKNRKSKANAWKGFRLSTKEGCRKEVIQDQSFRRKPGWKKPGKSKRNKAESSRIKRKKSCPERKETERRKGRNAEQEKLNMESSSQVRNFRKELKRWSRPDKRFEMAWKTKRKKIRDPNCS